MSRPLTARTLLRESAVIAAILLTSLGLGALTTVAHAVPALGLAGDIVRFVLIAVGGTLALLYVLARGLALGTSLPHETPRDVDAGSLLHGSGALLAPLALWFGLAAVSTVLVPYDPVNALVGTLVVGCTATGLATAALYVIARAASLVGSESLLAVRPAEE